MATTLEINVQDDLVRMFGIKAMKKFLEEELAYQRFKLLETELSVALSKAKNVDWDKEFEIARQEAFDEYQKLRKKNI